MKATLDYAAAGAPLQRTSRLARLALVAALLSFPITVLVFAAFGRLPSGGGARGPGPDVYVALGFGSMLIPAAIAIIALFRIGARRGQMRGTRYAVGALLVAITWCAAWLKYGAALWMS